MENNNEYAKELISLIAKKLDVDISSYDMDEMLNGMKVELEHGSRDEETNVTDDNPVQTFQIMLAHVKESSTYYTDLAKHVEKENADDTEENKNDMEKENLEESIFAKRMKELIGASENEDKKQLTNEAYRTNVSKKEPVKEKTLIKEVDESKFDVVEFKKTPIEDKAGEEGSAKELYQLNEDKEDDLIDLPFLNG